jgi:hypothetical protein
MGRIGKSSLHLNSGLLRLPRPLDPSPSRQLLHCRGRNCRGVACSNLLHICASPPRTELHQVSVLVPVPLLPHPEQRQDCDSEHGQAASHSSNDGDVNTDAARRLGAAAEGGAGLNRRVEGADVWCDVLEDAAAT